MIDTLDTPKGELKWAGHFSDEVSWKKTYHIAKHAAGTPYLHSFQYKIIQHILCTNVLLQKIKIKQHDTCDLCKNDKETIIHLFVQCCKVIDFWKDLETWLRRDPETAVSLDPKTILFGSPSGNKAVNQIIILAKNFIYKCKFKAQFPKLDLFICKLRYHISVEKYVAQISDSIETFTTKWSNIIRSLNG